MKLNLGCGKDYRDGWVNVDFYDDSTCDIKHDLEVFPGRGRTIPFQRF